MLKQFVIILIVSILAVFFMQEFVTVLHTLGHAQTYLASQLKSIAPKYTWFAFVSKLIILIGIPALISFVAAFVYWLVKKRELPRFMEIFWAVWAMSLLVFVLHR